ncbi:hypothetical protein MEN41_02800 [Dolichospermum sp. ST_con]|nr:hypothetical protein [Dolichospermum sp. ST_con]MDD1418302.1 hypothetical protein [Dolichospermum sp. ST_sed1]MDD1423146.1 hypothetical protein [Dolichospermum sp. ST_sed9]MDD1429550.1 hypothetical protein [Dolichospermum sp. ST_sed6]MDD1438880.1 hypothetical protein [Dolichospermum sp. ST_sed3]MDD1444996.1 hypothetical protein [Dolichospermum sp. ST_sed8]MDD1453379.1 hypothetical protein [Dolichospermum sp. ST_sed7]MDD1458870.1 hypothetical protein [Dolichospermum sp. ST_sed2]MDD1466361
MNEEVFQEIRSVITTISILQSRERVFRQELDFFNQSWKDASEEACRILFIGAFKRLEHEIMFLCIEVYSLHEGIAKKRSLYSKVIRQNGKLLSQVDKTPGDENSYQCLGIIGSHGKRDCTTEEKNDMIQKEEYKNREEIRDNSGITSHNHDEINEWFNQVLDEDILSTLNEYRQKFAHRLDNLENLKLEQNIGSPDNVEKILDVVSTVLDKYKCCFQDIIVYTRSELFTGFDHFEYDSLSRLKLALSLETEKEELQIIEKVSISETPSTTN